MFSSVNIWHGSKFIISLDEVIFGKITSTYLIQISHWENFNVILGVTECIKENGFSFWGSNSAIYLFVSVPNRSQSLKIRICSPKSKFFPLRLSSFWKGFTVQGSKQKNRKVVSLCQNGGETWKFTHPAIHKIKRNYFAYQELCVRIENRLVST